MQLSRVFWIGILICSCLLLFFYGIRYLQDESFQSSTFTFKVIFKDAQGVDSGDEVRMLGKRVGFVKSTSIVGHNIMCEININKDLEKSIPIDSKIEITQEDIMGSKVITIFPGKNVKKFILDGETISGRNAEVVSLTQDIGDFARKINDTFGIQQKEQLINTIANVDVAMQELNDFISINKDIILPEDKENLHLILNNFNDISLRFKSVMASQEENIQIAIANITDFTLQLPDLSNKINTLSAKLSTIVENINNGKGSLAKLIDDDALYNNTNQLMADAKDLVNDVQKNPKKYIKAYFQAQREDKRENK